MLSTRLIDADVGKMNGPGRWNVITANVQSTVVRVVLDIVHCLAMCTWAARSGAAIERARQARLVRRRPILERLAGSDRMPAQAVDSRVRC